jgi:hypothetical protein
MRKTNTRRTKESTTMSLARLAVKASTNARQSALSRGIPVTVQHGDNIVKIYPNGTTEVIRKIEKHLVNPEKRIYKI